MAGAAEAAGRGGGGTEPQGALDRAVFLRPIAHRGLHDRRKGRIENSAPAFLAAIDKGYGIECDLQAAKDGVPMVFHDERLDRLLTARGRIGELPSGELAALHYRGLPSAARGILTFSECLSLIKGRVPLLAEVKRNRKPPPKAFLDGIAAASGAYRGPLALMSFDRDLVIKLGRLLPAMPRGWIVGRHELAARWLTPGRSTARAVSRLLATAPKGIAFLAVDVGILKPVRAIVDDMGLSLPLFTWTVRNVRERGAAARFADAPIFEGYEP
jgi:glycerophosphoryl diester phosphodiesterase